MAIILPANTLAAGGYAVDNSCQFIDADNAYMVRSATGTSSESNNKWTFSCWVKRSKLGAEQMLMDHRGSGNQFNIRFMADDSLQCWDYVGGALMQKDTTAVYRDSGAWYHILWSSDRSIASPTTKLWVNGAEVTSWATDNEYSQDDTGAANQDYDTWIGGENSSGARLGAYIAEMVWLDGTFVSDATDFGEYDEDSPTIWKPIDVSGLTFGTNGWYFDFKDSSNLGNDANGGTDFSETNISAVHQVTDTPSNNFCLLNQLQVYGSGANATNDGGTQFVGTQGNAWRVVSGSIAVTTGKYYYEVEINTSSANNSYSIGWLSTNNLPATAWTSYLGDVDGPALGLGKGGTLDYSTHAANSQTDTGWTTYTNGGNIIMCAIDLDNNYAYWGLDGTWMKSGDPESGATGTGGFAFENTAGYDWFPAFGSTEGASGSTVHMAANFGHGSFANVSGAPSAVASAGANASGFGVFEFDVPDGYGAICTKQMNE